VNATVALPTSGVNSPGVRVARAGRRPPPLPPVLRALSAPSPRPRRSPTSTLPWAAARHRGSERRSSLESAPSEAHTATRGRFFDVHNHVILDFHPVQPAMVVGRRRRGRGTARDQARKGVRENANSSCLWERGEALAGDLVGRPSSQRTRRPHQQQWTRLYQTAASGASGRGDGAVDSAV